MLNSLTDLVCCSKLIEFKFKPNTLECQKIYNFTHYSAFEFFLLVVIYTVMIMVVKGKCPNRHKMCKQAEGWLKQLQSRGRHMHAGMGEICMFEDQVCNEIFECMDSSDEENCSKLCYSSEHTNCFPMYGIYNFIC